MSPSLHSVYIDSDMYEVLFKDNTITRVIKYTGDSQLRREVEFLDLPTRVRDKIVEEIMFSQIKTNPR